MRSTRTTCHMCRDVTGQVEFGLILTRVSVSSSHGQLVILQMVTKLSTSMVSVIIGYESACRTSVVTVTLQKFASDELFV